ncbi:GNAT family N-acetyltransferase [Pedobacter nanyangensis]|uniref:GNAT family N-acetyltransferase n=1 Tax=Pedobacter nanyangensis TaxID=1562389 RepID=UPI0013B44850|nr:GNAT family N-acetyltransferase [Pedobacter nanyangensis]
MSETIQIEQIFPSLTWRIRQQAMYADKEITEMELADDFEGTHFGLYFNHELTAVVSLFVKDGMAQFRKLAVLPSKQRNGLGKLLLQYVIDYCKQQPVKLLWCNARVSAVGFYEKFGFVTEGEPYQRNQLDYIKMQLIF